MNRTTLFPTMSIIYGWNWKRLVDTIMSYLTDAYRVFNHLMRLNRFSLCVASQNVECLFLVDSLGDCQNCSKRFRPDFYNSNFH